MKWLRLTVTAVSVRLKTEKLDLELLLDEWMKNT